MSYTGRRGARREGRPRTTRHVEAAAPGTSFNPDPEQHQAALATAVAQEVGKNLERELGVKAPGQIAPAVALAAFSITDGMDELAMLQVSFFISALTLIRLLCIEPMHLLHWCLKCEIEMLKSVACCSD